MIKKPNNLSSDLRGASQLAIDAVKGTTKVVEALHSTISQFTPLLGDPKQKTSGITAVVYNSIHTVTQLIGVGIDAILTKSSDIQDQYTKEHSLSLHREAIASAMNGVLGDHFENSDNPLAITMSLRVAGKTVTVDQLNAINENNKNQITVFIHGLCMNDLQWSREGHNHGEGLARDLNHTVIYLHYNTGLHVSENGRQFTHLLNSIKTISSTSVNFIGHSMGGLVSRSACYYANELGHEWLSSLKKMVFLGTPHHGALLAKGGHWADVFLEISPYSAPFAKITKARSHGLTDLRHGSIIDENWQNQGQRQEVPLPDKVTCYAIATSSSSKGSTKIKDTNVGDGLVSLNSALGIHPDKKPDLKIDQQNKWIGNNISHMQLLSSQEVYQVIKKWLT